MFNLTALIRCLPAAWWRCAGVTAALSARVLCAWCVVWCVLTGWTPVAQAQQASQAEGAQPAGSGMTEKEFFDILSGLVYLGQRDAAAAYAHVLRAARSTGDEDLFQLAMEVGWAGKSPQRAQLAAREWLRQHAGSIRAARALVQVSVESGRYADSIRPLRQLLRNIPKQKVGPVVLFSTRYYQRAAGQEEVAAVDAFEKAVRDYTSGSAAATTRASALAAVARLRWLAQQDGQAVNRLQEARNAAPRSDHVALVAMEMAAQGSEPANTILRLYMRDNPNVPADIGLEYARLLIGKKQTRPAIQQLRNVVRSEADNAQAWLLLAALQEEAGQLEAAKKAAERVLAIAAQQRERANEPTEGEADKDKAAEAASASGGDGEDALRDPLESDRQQVSARQVAQVQLLLSGITSRQGDSAAAEQWLGKVDRSVFNDAGMVTEQRAMVLAKQNRMKEALQLVEGIPDDARTPAQKLDTEVRLYSALKQYGQAYESSLRLLQLEPDNPEFLYGHGILAERLARYDEMEKNMRRVMALEPDSPDAYNALGYSFAVRSVRLDEAKKLIEKALTKAPGDPYVTDSLAWVEYRLGNTTRALELLETVFAQKSDPEIAAHYGELLYVSGEKTKAAAVWREAAQTIKGRENSALLETMRRFQQPLP